MGTGLVGSVFGEISQENVCRVPLAAIRHVRARQTSETGPCGDCRRVLWVPGLWGQYSGKFVLSRDLGYKTRGGGRYVAKRSSEPRRVYPEVKFQGRDLVRVVGIVVHFAPLGIGTHGKFVL